VTLRTLKKGRDKAGRPRIVYRAVLMPPDYLDIMNAARGIGEAQRTQKRGQGLHCRESRWPILLRR